MGTMGNVERVVEPSKFVAGHSDDTKILDIGLDEIGALLGLTNSIRFIPEKYVKKTRRVFIKFLRMLVENVVSVIFWKKFLLLSTVLLGGYNGEDDMKTEFDLRLELLLNDDWDNFTLGRYLKRENIGAALAETTDSQEKRKNVRIDKFMQSGEYSRAMALVCSDEKQVIPSQEVFNKLQGKHPKRNVDIGMTAVEMQSLLEYKVPENDEHVMPWSSLRASVKHLHKFVKHGPDKLRNEHLQALVGSKDEEPPADELEFCTLMAAVVSHIVNGHVPSEVSAAIRDSEMFAGPKGTNDVRPIGIGCTLRKLAGRECFNLTKSFNAKHSRIGNMR